jgi:hypothetical protein
MKRTRLPRCVFTPAERFAGRRTLQRSAHSSLYARRRPCFRTELACFLPYFGLQMLSISCSVSTNKGVRNTLVTKTKFTTATQLQQHVKVNLKKLCKTATQNLNIRSAQLAKEACSMNSNCATPLLHPPSPRHYPPSPPSVIWIHRHYPPSSSSFPFHCTIGLQGRSSRGRRR